MARYVAGDVIGDFDFAIGSAMDATARSDTDAQVLAFPSGGLCMQDLAKEKPDAASRILLRSLSMISSRLRSTQRLISDNSPWVRELRRQIYTDPGTGLWSRAFLDEELHRKLEKPTAVVMVKPDRFKELNDAQGHSAGDEAMALISGILVGETERLGRGWALRLRSNETAIVIPRCDAEEATAAARRLSASISAMDVSGRSRHGVLLLLEHVPRGMARGRRGLEAAGRGRLWHPHEGLARRRRSPVPAQATGGKVLGMGLAEIGHAEGSIPDFLAGLPLFRDMSGLEVNAVSAFLEPRRYSRGGVVFREGESGMELFIVRSGRIGSYVTQSDGTRRDVYEFSPGVLFGEMAIIENEPRSATCYAKEDAELLVLDGIDFYRLVWEHPVIGVKLLSSMARVMTAWLDEASGFLGRPRALGRGGPTPRRHRRALRPLQPPLPRGDHGHALRSRRRLLAALRDADARHRPLPRTQRGPRPRGRRRRDRRRRRGLRPAVPRGRGRSRLSGDEFAVFLPNGAMDRALELGEAMRRAAEELYLEFRHGPDAMPARASITVSVGAAAAPEHASTPKSLVAAADKALYKAKEAGRNRVEPA